MSTMTFDAGAVNDIDQSTVQIDGVLYPTVQWVYANPAMKKAGGMDYLGGFFIAEDAVSNPDAFLAAAWTATEWTHQDGTSTMGFWRRDLRIAVVNYRQRWEVQGEEGGNVAFAWTDFDSAKALAEGLGKTPTGRTHALIRIEGMEDEGLFVLTLRGVGARAFAARNNNDAALAVFSRTVLAAANRESDIAARANKRETGKKWPYRAYWLPLGAARTPNGDPVFVKAGNASDAKSVVLPVAMGLPAKMSDIKADDLGKWYVGNDLLAVLRQDWYDAEENWSHAWDNIDPGVSTAPVAKENLPDAQTIAGLGI